MKVLVFGAAGKTGRLVVDRALAKGHEITALLRDPSKFRNKGIRVLIGDATSPADVLKAMKGQDAVIDSIGGATPYKATRLESTSARNMIDAMQQEGVRRLIVVSMMGIGTSRSQAPFWYKYLLMPTFLHGSTKDKTLMEQEVSASNLDYVIVRPPILKDGASKGSVNVLKDNTIGHAITRADLADFLIDQLESDTHLRQAVTVVNT